MKKNDLTMVLENIERNIHALAAIESKSPTNVNYKTLMYMQSVLETQQILCKERLRSKGDQIDDIQVLQRTLPYPAHALKTAMKLFETYIATTPNQSSRIDMSYLVTIESDALVDCLTRVKRADYLIDKGLVTSVAVSPRSIVVPMMLRSTDEVYVSDLRDWAIGRPEVLIIPAGESRLAEIQRLGENCMVFFDDVLLDSSTKSIDLVEFARMHTKPDRWYYDPLADRPDEFHGHKISYLEPSDEHLFPCF
jgi:hypothetical protein